MYELFSLSGALAVWKVRYCTDGYRECARYKGSAANQPVPVNLLPNGKLLKK